MHDSTGDPGPIGARRDAGPPPTPFGCHWCGHASYVRAACWDVPHDPSAIAKVRALVDDTLAAWTLRHLADDVVLVAGELLANAVVHGDAPATLSLRAGAGELRMEVTDHGPGQPRHLRLDTDAPHGRGLTIVEALSCDSGVVPLPDHPGKTVWARWWLSPGTTRTTSRPSV